jgi:hypothetical protein
VARNDYAINAGHQSIDHGGSENKQGPPPPEGATDGLAGRAYVVKIKNITDGLSKTYLVGEKYVNPDHYADGLDLGDNENAYIGSDRDVFRHSFPPCRDRAGLDCSYSFGSSHASAFFMAFCDGSVRPSLYDIDLAAHERLVDRSDATPLDASGTSSF